MSTMSRTSVEGFDPHSFRTLRERAGLTRSQLSRLSGIGLSTLAAWEAGRMTPTVTYLRAAMSILGRPMQDVITQPQHPTLRSLRVNRGLRRDQVAEHMHMSLSGFSQIERGDVEPTEHRIQQLAALFQLDEQAVQDATRNTRQQGLPPLPHWPND